MMTMSADEQETTPFGVPQHHIPPVSPGDLPASESRAARAIREIFQSGRPLTYIHTAEEQHGLRRRVRSGQPLTARRAGFAGHREPAIFYLKDFHEPLRESPEIRRRLRDVYEQCIERQKFVVITSPVRFVPEGLERSMTFFELRPPDLIELMELLRQDYGPAAPDDAREDLFRALARALQGLTLDEARPRRKAAHWSIAAASSSSSPAGTVSGRPKAEVRAPFS